jgi:hypothetical protein
MSVNDDPPCPPGVSAGLWGKALKMCRFLELPYSVLPTERMALCRWVADHLDDYDRARGELYARDLFEARIEARRRQRAGERSE